MIVIRKMYQDDVEQVLAIDTTVCEFPWTYSIFSDCIKVGYSCWVLEDDDVQEVVGFGLFSVAAHEAHILNLCIKPQHQGLGLGKKMMVHLLKAAKAEAANTIYLEVRLSNQRAFELYLSLGFEVIGCRKDYYPAVGGREDALVLEKTLLP